MKTTLPYLALLVVALSCGIAFVLVFKKTDDRLSEPVTSGLDTPKVIPHVEPAPLETQSIVVQSHDARQAAVDPPQQTPPESEPAGDSPAGLAMLDQLARDIVSGRAPGDVFEALSADSRPGTLDAAVRLLAGKETASFTNFDSLPPSFVDALSAAVRKHPDQEGLSQALDAAWQETSDPVVRSRLESLEVPGLYAARAADLAAAGDTAASVDYLARLETCGHPGTLDSFASLTTQPGIDFNDLCAAAWNWAARFPNLANSPDLALEARLTDPAFSAAQQIIAAAALAAAAPGAETVAALEKAVGEQHAGDWRTAMEYMRDFASSVAEAKR